jgi:uncharacterized membrane protein
MTLLLLGLILFLGVHSTRIFADGFRSAQRARLGENGWKAAYSVASLVGFVLLVYGFGQARADSPVLWTPPVYMRHLAALLVAAAFVLLAAAYVPGNAIKAKLGHPMILGVKTWALAHLLANGRLVDVLLFGAFLVWAILDFASSRRHVRPHGAGGRRRPRGMVRLPALAAPALDRRRAARRDGLIAAPAAAGSRR